MNIRLLTLSDSRQWLKLLEQIPESLNHPGLSPGWYSLFEARGYGKAFCMVAEDERGVILYPFLKNTVPAWFSGGHKPYYDIQGAPGYNGLATNNESPEFLQDFHHAFTLWCAEQHIVAEFSRCDPASGNHRFFPESCLTEINRNIIVNLQEAEVITAGYDRSAVKNIRKAEREGLHVKIFRGQETTDDLLEHFAKIYHETMARNNATAEYLFAVDFFTDVRRFAGNQVLFCFTYLDDQPVACEAVVYNGLYAWSWLGGTISAFYPLRPNDMLKHHINYHLKHMGVRQFCLGGGLKPGDGIFRYKRSFAITGEAPFFIVKRIHLPDIYGRLMTEWKDMYPHLTPQVGNRLLAYREQ